MDRVFPIHAGSRESDSHRRHMSERFVRSNRPEYPHPVCSKLENSGIRVAVSGIHLIEPAKLYMCMQTHYKNDEDGCTAPGVRGHVSVLLSHLEKVIMRIGLHTNKSYDIVL